MDQERQPFISSNRREKLESRGPRALIAKLYSRLDNPPVFWKLTTILALAATISLSICTSVLLTHKPCPPNPPRGHLQSHLPLKIHSRPTHFHSSEHTYFGVPTPATDSAWAAILQSMYMRASPSELDDEVVGLAAQSNQTLVVLPADGMHLVWMGVYHDLHCINMLRRWIRREYYFPNLTADKHAFAKMESHVDHCMDMLRQATLCHADTTLMTFRWAEGEPRPMFSTIQPQRMCVDFAAMQESLRSRVVGLDEIQRLRNPLL
ncbi:hypothetical protein BJX64DRAFT_246510 [Aspergillus heterothallicus]